MNEEDISPTACIVCNGESEKGKGCRNCGDILEGSDYE
jgi:hypothetical protein